MEKRAFVSFQSQAIVGSASQPNLGQQQGWTAVPSTPKRKTRPTGPGFQGRCCWLSRVSTTRHSCRQKDIQPWEGRHPAGLPGNPESALPLSLFRAVDACAGLHEEVRLLPNLARARILVPRLRSHHRCSSCLCTMECSFPAQSISSRPLCSHIGHNPWEHSSCR